jgi:hypothetical protein
LDLFPKNTLVIVNEDIQKGGSTVRMDCMNYALRAGTQSYEDSTSQLIEKVHENADSDRTNRVTLAERTPLKIQSTIPPAHGQIKLTPIGMRKACRGVYFFFMDRRFIAFMALPPFLAAFMDFIRRMAIFSVSL